MAGRRVLIVTGQFPYPTQTFVARECASLLEAGWDLSILSSHPDESAWPHALEFGISRDLVRYCRISECQPRWMQLLLRNPAVWKAADLKTYGVRVGLRRIAFLHALLPWLRERKFELVHAHYIEWGLDVGLAISQLMRIPLTTIGHDSHLLSHGQAVLQRMQQRTNAVAIVNQAYMRSWAQTTGSAERLTYLPNGIVLDDFVQPLRQHSNEEFLIASVGRCADVKRVDLLISAVKLLRDRGVRVRAIHIGGGPLLENLIQQTRQLGLESVFEFKGACPHSKVRELMRSANAFVLCSSRESFGVVTAEAMACGLPVIASKTAGSCELVEHGSTGFLFEQEQVNELATYIEQLVASPELCQRLGTAGEARVRERFSWEHHMALLTEILHAALDEGYRGG